eukprot:834333-Prymnesium_polylepis.1
MLGIHSSPGAHVRAHTPSPLALRLLATPWPPPRRQHLSPPRHHAPRPATPHTAAASRLVQPSPQVFATLSLVAERIPLP